MKIEFWPPEAESSEIRQFIKSLDKPLRKKVIRDLSLIRIHNNLHHLIKMGIIKPLRVSLHEITSKSIRIIIIVKNNVCWLLKAFKKKSNKTPERHIMTARQRANDIP